MFKINVLSSFLLYYANIRWTDAKQTECGHLGDWIYGLVGYSVGLSYSK